MRSPAHRFLHAVLVLWIGGCGASTGLKTPEPVATSDGGALPTRDAGMDGGIDGGEAELDAAAEGSDAFVPDAGAACVELSATFGTTFPTVVLLIDRSGSMTVQFRQWTPRYFGASRWEVITEILVGDEDTEGLLHRNQARIRYGLIAYTTEDGLCPYLDIVPPALNNAEAIARVLRGESPAGGTPTGETIATATEMRGAFASGADPISLVLATDGEPNGCSTEWTGTTGTIAATEAAYEVGIRTYVISVGDDVSSEHLQDVANAGAGHGEGDSDAEFWIGRAPSGLQAALAAAVSSALACRGRLSRPLISGSSTCELEVAIDGAPLRCDDPNGFRLTDPGHIEVMGAACARLREGLPLTIDAPCGVVGP